MLQNLRLPSIFSVAVTVGESGMFPAEYQVNIVKLGPTSPSFVVSGLEGDCV